MAKRLKIYGYCNKGYEGMSVEINCDIHSGFPGFDIIGLPDKVISESKEMIRTALRNSGFKFPQQRVLVSLSPASVQKSGSLLELGIALSILFASANKGNYKEIKIMAAGELNLDGSIVPDTSSAGAIAAARKLGCHFCFVPFEDTGEPGVFYIRSLAQAFLKTGEALNTENYMSLLETGKLPCKTIFSNVIGMEYEKNILSIAACSYHSILLFGPPGVGKTMLCSLLNKLVPKHSDSEQLVLKQIYGCAKSNLDDYENPLLTIVPHDCSPLQFTGGAALKSPGLGSLAHKGVLLLDELNKYSPSLLESVKDTFDKGYTLSCKSGESVMYPARFLLTANMNACSCTNLGSANAMCTCTSQRIAGFWNKVNKAFVERFSIRLPVAEYDIASMTNEKQKEDSYYVDKICNARDRQAHRLKGTGITLNGDIRFASSPFTVFKEETDLFRKYFANKNNEFRPSNARSQIELIALARTIADYNDREKTTDEDLLQAIELRKYCTNGDYYWRQIAI